MPFKSRAKEKWMFANKPKMAKEFKAETPTEKLPEYVDKTKKNADDVARYLKAMRRG